jgi:hypothetical protein
MTRTIEDELNELFLKLFKMFARFEYALKAAGYHEGNGEANPNWRKFAESIPDVFDNPSTTELQTAINYLEQHPPKKQVVKDNVLEWKVSVPSTNLKSDLILLYVRRVRNNLFHGGKFNDRWFAPERSQELLCHSLTVLQACLDASPEVKKAYEH